MDTTTITYTTRVSYVPDGTDEQRPYISIDYQLREALCVWLREAVRGDHMPVSVDITYDDVQTTATGLVDTRTVEVPPTSKRPSGQKSKFAYLTSRIDAEETITQAKRRYAQAEKLAALRPAASGEVAHG